MAAINNNVTEIQISSSDLVLFYNGDEIVNAVSRIVPASQTFIMRDGQNIMILQSGGSNYPINEGASSLSDPFVFNVRILEKIGGKDFDAVNPVQNTAANQLQAKAIAVYNWLVQYVFQGCCECGCENGCSINYSWNDDLGSGQFYITEDVSESTLSLSINTTSGNGQELADLLAALPNGSWITFIGASDASLISVVEISGYSVDGDVVTFDLELIEGESTFTGNPKFCLTFQPALGGGGGSQTWQETLIEGSVLTQDNTADAQGLYDFTWDGFVNWLVQATNQIYNYVYDGIASTYSELIMNTSSTVIKTSSSLAKQARITTASNEVTLEVRDDVAQAGGSVRHKLTEDEMLIRGPFLFNGAQYESDYEANFVDRTLVTKQWVLALAAGVQPDAWKQPCEVATTANITLSGEQTIDGVLTALSRVLVKDQSTQTQNGIYVSAAGAWTRATDMDVDAEFLGAVVGITLGTTNANTYWIQETAPVTLGVSNIVFTAFALPTTFGGAIIDITVVGLQGLQATSLINPQVYYRVTDATPVPCLVSGASVNSSSTFAILEGTSDGTGITTSGGIGNYDLLNGTFNYAYVYDSLSAGLFLGINTFANTLTGSSVYEIHQNASGNIVETANYIELHQNAINNDLAVGADVTKLEQFVQNFVFGNNLDYCTIKQGLNGNKADNSGPIDFITGVTFLYNRTSPWEIRDIDRTNELLFLYVTYGDGSDPEEGWYDPATDVFTPVVSGGGVASVVAGTNISVDNTDPDNPIVNSLSDRYKTTSTTSNSVSNGSKTFTVDADLSYIPLQEVLIVFDLSHHMHGTVTSYSGTTLIVDVSKHTGSGTYTSWLINLDGTPVDAITGTGTANQLAYFTAGSVLGSLDTTTYPSLTELSYVKGVTSAIQTQLNGKQGNSIEVTGSLTAVNGSNYIQTATATYTDPTPVTGQGYVVTVIAGTATIGGTAYPTVGTIIKRYYNGSVWVNSIMNPVAANILYYQASASHGTLGGTVTRFLVLSGVTLVTLTASSQAVYYFANAGTFRSFRLRTNSAQPAGGDLVFTVMSGATPSSLSASTIVATVATGSAAGTFTSGNTLTISAGDYVCVRGVNGSGSASAQIADYYIEFIPS